MDGEVLVGDLEEYDSGYESEGSARRDRSGHAHRPSRYPAGRTVIGPILCMGACCAIFQHWISRNSKITDATGRTKSASHPGITNTASDVAQAASILT